MNEPRPTVNTDMIRAAILSVAPKLANDPGNQRELEAITANIEGQYHYPMDGFELALQLCKYVGWDVTRDEADEMDAIDSRVRKALDDAEKAWSAAFPMEPPFPIGTAITRGVITGIYEHGPARYLVKEPGSDDSRRLIIKFEDAKVATHQE